MWNLYILDEQNGQLGEHIYLDWVVWDRGLAHSFSTWQLLVFFPVETISEVNGVSKEISTRQAKMHSTICDIWHQKRSLPFWIWRLIDGVLLS